MSRPDLVLTSPRAMEEALATAPQRIHRLMAARPPHPPRLERIFQAARRAGLAVTLMDPRQMKKKYGAPMALLMHAVPVLSFEELIAETADARAYWVMLWKVTNVGNFGAIIRSAYAFGAAGLMALRKGMPAISNDLIHASAGTALRLPIAAVDSAPRAFQYARAAGIEIWALDNKGTAPVNVLPPRQPHIWLAGTEDRGLPHSVLRSANRIFRIPMRPRAESLNVSVSVAVACYESSKHHYGIPTT